MTTLLPFELYSLLVWPSHQVNSIQLQQVNGLYYNLLFTWHPHLPTLPIRNRPLRNLMGYLSFSKAQFWLKMNFSFLATFELCFGLCYLLSLRGKSRSHSEPHYQQWCILMCTDNTYPHLHVFSFPASCFPNSPHTRILAIFPLHKTLSRICNRTKA